MAELEPLDDEDLQILVRQAIEDAVEHVDGEVKQRREKALRYYRGKVDLGETPGRSRVVVTVAKDAVRGVMPNLVRMFLASDRAVDFVAHAPEDQPIAQLATPAVNHIFREQNPGYRLFIGAVLDALTQLGGFIHYEWIEDRTPRHYTLTGLLPEEAAEIEREEAGGRVAIRATETRETELGPVVDLDVIEYFGDGRVQLTQIPPADLFVDSEATGVDDAYCIGYRRAMSIAELVALGHDYDELDEIEGAEAEDDETATRRRRTRTDEDDDEHAIDPASRKLDVFRSWVWIDADGDGVAELHDITAVGHEQKKIIADELVDEVPIAHFVAEIEPDAFFPECLVEHVIQDQDAKTALMRSILDNAAAVNNPRHEYVQSQVNENDLKNGEIGGLIRVRQLGQIRDIVTPFTAGQTLPVLDYLDRMTESRTGLSRQSLGLDPDILQSTTKEAVTATVSAAQGMVEYIGRTVAETGMRRLFGGVLRLLVAHGRRPMTVRHGTDFMTVDPRPWHAELGVTVNVGLGSGREEQKAAILQQFLGLQVQQLQAGIQQVPPQVYATLERLGELAGIKDVSPFFVPANPAQPQQPQQQPGQQSDPNAAFLQAEQLKVRQKAQSDAQKIALQAEEMRRKDDRERDEAAREWQLEQAKLLGEYGIKADEAAMRAEVERDRNARDQQARIAAARMQADARRQQQTARPSPGGAGGAGQSGRSGGPRRRPR